MGLPDGWNDYDRVGKQVEGTRFIAFKVPLSEGINRGCGVPEEEQLHPKLLVSLIPKLGLVIDLTNTTKYYNPEEFSRLGVKYQKIYVQGHVIPTKQCFAQFRETVNNFLEEETDTDKLIGVHCTHGLNRSGFLVCRYMIEEMGFSASDAIEAFERGRGHKMERQNYLNELKRLSIGGETSSRIPKKEKPPLMAIDTEHDKGCQTERGYWISESSLLPHHRNSMRSSISGNATGKQVSLIGCVDIKNRELISDGHGGYFVHITKKEIKKKNPRQNDSQRYDQRGRDNQRTQRNDNNWRSNQQPMNSGSYVPPHKRSQNRTNRSQNQRPRFSDPSYGLPDQYDLHSSNLTEELLNRISSASNHRNPYTYERH